MIGFRKNTSKVAEIAEGSDSEAYLEDSSGCGDVMAVHNG